jgi:hypothetical protein
VDVLAELLIVIVIADGDDERISSRTLASFICHDHSILSVFRLLDQANECSYGTGTRIPIAVPADESGFSGPF